MDSLQLECMESYLIEKDVAQRSRLLKHLLCSMPGDAKVFFSRHSKKNATWI